MTEKGKTMSTGEIYIQVQDLNFDYPDGTKALKDINLEIAYIRWKSSNNFFTTYVERTTPYIAFKRF